MKPIAPEQWLIPDTEAGLWLNNKRLLMKLMRDKVSAGDLDGQAAQELLYKVIEETGEIPSQNMPTALEEAASLVSDDLCILEEDRPGDWRLSAGVLCAPTYWSLPERIGMDLGGLHGPVPGGDPGLSNRVGRIFTGLRPRRVLERFNWTVQVGAERFTPERPPITGAGVQDLYLRVERQTIRKLLHSKAVVFTIRICTDPLVPILENTDWREAFEDAWIGAPNAVRHYKGWNDMEPLIRAACRRAAFAL
ncbi:MAG: heme-dependent oxidative N-demethylase subunit alpha family protein [Pseudomonadota bacterium]